MFTDPREYKFERNKYDYFSHGALKIPDQHFRFTIYSLL